MTEHPPSQRLDRWLCCARFVKTRGLAAKLIQNSGVRIDGTRTDKPHALVRPGHVLTFALGPYIRVIRVTGLAERRGPAREAQSLYEDLDPPKREAAMPRGWRLPDHALDQAPHR